jgi:hypothetical protein
LDFLSGVDLAHRVVVGSLSDASGVVGLAIGGVVGSLSDASGVVGLAIGAGVDALQNEYRQGSTANRISSLSNTQGR